MPQLTVKLKVVIVDDHALFVDCFQLALNQLERVEVVGTYTTVEKYLKNLDSTDFDIVFMDIDFKKDALNGIDATKETLRRKPKVKIIAVSMHNDGVTVEQMLKAGALGFLPKDVHSDKIKTAIGKVCKGELYIAPSAASNYMSNAVSSMNKEPNAGEKKRALTKVDFTQQELDIMQYSADGISDKEIAEKLNMKKKQVDYEKNKLYKKLNVKNVAEMTAVAVRLKLVS